MDEIKKDQTAKEKSPTLAAVLSMLPGMGAFYNGNIIKGIAYVIIFAVLIMMQDYATGPDQAVFGLLLGAFYIFQIFDSFNEAKALNQAKFEQTAEEKRGKEDISLFSAVLILFVGIAFQLANFDVITYHQVTKLWPLILIAVGLNIILRHLKKEGKNEQHKK